jgi:hypothetical protein
VQQPKTRNECVGVTRPCPFWKCRHHVADRSGEGRSCALDVVEQNPDGLPLEEVGRMFGVSRERIRQIQNEAIAKLQERVRVTSLTRGELFSSTSVESPWDNWTDSIDRGDEPELRRAIDEFVVRNAELVRG